MGETIRMAAMRKTCLLLTLGMSLALVACTGVEDQRTKYFQRGHAETFESVACGLAG